LKCHALFAHHIRASTSKTRSVAAYLNQPTLSSVNQVLIRALCSLVLSLFLLRFLSITWRDVFLADKASFTIILAVIG
jgi:hypothetical protein